jgi:hypothetical protein
VGTNKNARELLKMKKIFALGMVVMVCLVLLVGCDDNGSELTPAINGETNSAIGIPPFSIFIEGELYTFFHFVEGIDNRRDTADYEFIGSVIAETSESESLIPSENFHAFGFAVGSRIYRIDGELLYVEFDNQIGFSRAGYAVGFNDEDRAWNYGQE